MQYLRYFLYPFLLLVLAKAPFAVGDDDDPASDVIPNLCASGKSEGAYTLSLPKIGRVSVYVICQGNSSMVATMSDAEAGVPVTFGYTAIDGDILSFLTFSPEDDDTPEMDSNANDGRLQVSITDLKNSKLTGTYRSLFTKKNFSFSVPQTAAFPNLLATANRDVNASSQFKGDFVYEGMGFVGQTGGQVWLINDVIGGIQRIVININNGVAATLWNGLKQSSAGNVFYATSGNDSTEGGLRLTQHIRGRIIGPDEVEFYYLTSRTGMLGPYRAKRGIPATNF